MSLLLLLNISPQAKSFVCAIIKKLNCFHLKYLQTTDVGSPQSYSENEMKLNKTSYVCVCFQLALFKANAGDSLRLVFSTFHSFSPITDKRVSVY